MNKPRYFSLADAGDFLGWLNAPGSKRLDDLAGTDIYVLVGLSTLGRQELAAPIQVELGSGPVSGFAQAVGLPQAVAGTERRAAREPDRSVTLARFRRQQAEEIDALSLDIARLMAGQPGGGAVEAIRYVIVELLRNVIQHSEDRFGGV